MEKLPSVLKSQQFLMDQYGYRSVKPMMEREDDEDEYLSFV